MSNLGPVTREDLEAVSAAKGNLPGHDALALVPSCHPKSGAKAMYRPQDGTLELYCAKCSGLFVVLLIAHASDDNYFSV